ncbi:MAG TPA: multiprotein bridging factor aMBF1 [Verrucomicrobiae bacterium]|nr:multiprotein bridging factor aMBF1 [Verrucomicrobiae bacterium]
MRCEVCGHKIRDEPITAIIEGAKLTVCVECSKHGKIIHEEEVALPQKNLKKPQAPVTMVQRKPIVAKVEITQEPAEDYANKIRVAREKLALTHEELGKKINEKASVLRNLEAGKMTPNNQLASKLEHMLKIKLLVPISEEKVTQIPQSANQELTLGDLIKLDKKGGEEITERKPS